METINISSLKAHISAVLEKVRKGASFVVLDRKTPIARIVGAGFTKLEMEHIPSGDFRVPRSRGLRVKKDPLDFLNEERSRR